MVGGLGLAFAADGQPAAEDAAGEPDDAGDVAAVLQPVVVIVGADVGHGDAPADEGDAAGQKTPAQLVLGDALLVIVAVYVDGVLVADDAVEALVVEALLALDGIPIALLPVHDLVAVEGGAAGDLAGPVRVAGGAGLHLLDAGAGLDPIVDRDGRLRVGHELGARGGAAVREQGEREQETIAVHRCEPGAREHESEWRFHLNASLRPKC
jgi:hypothetical protein